MEESRQAFTIFVEGADTAPPKVPVNTVFGEKYASRICESLKKTEYAAFDFSFERLTASNLTEIPAWAVMIEDAHKGVYGEIVAGICNLTERLYLFMGGRRGNNSPPSDISDHDEWNGREVVFNDDAEPKLPAVSAGVAARNAWFLEQYEAMGTDTYHKPAMIHAKWEAMKATERAEICPDSPNKVAKSTVESSIKRTKQMRDGKKPTNNRKKMKKTD